MNIGGLLAVSAITVWAVMTLAYYLATYLKNLGLVDIFWGLGFMFIAIAVQQAVGTDFNQAFLVVWTLVMIWGARLALHIGARFKPAEEDWRYKKMRDSWGKETWWKSYVNIFMLQGLLMLLVAVPIYLSPLVEPPTWQIVLGVLVWISGFAIEAISDNQLQQFIKTKKTKGDFIKTGFWKYSRHPNYFGEVTQWWGLFIVVVSLSNWWLAIISPVVITTLILKVSGVPMLEKRWEGNKKYQAYAKQTNAFIPWPKKS